MTRHDTAFALAEDRHTYTPDEPRAVLNAADILAQHRLTTNTECSCPDGVPFNQDHETHVAWVLYHAGALA